MGRQVHRLSVVVVFGRTCLRVLVIIVFVVTFILHVIQMSALLLIIKSHQRKHFTRPLFRPLFLTQNTDMRSGSTDLLFVWLNVVKVSSVNVE